MARTQAPDYERRRAAIVAHAAELYARRGFPGASVADLAEACATSKSLIYHYYASKEDILFDVMASHIGELEAAAAGVASADGDPAGKLRALVHAFMRLYAGAAARQKVLLNELDHLPAARRAEIVARQRRLVETVEGLLADIQPRLRGRAGLRRPAAMLVFGMINWTHTWFDPAGPLGVDELAELAADMALDGLRGLAGSAGQRS
jgi:AcrR family transcriptional regulator